MVKKRKLSKVFFAFLALVLFSTVIFNVNAAETYDSANFTKKGDVVYFEKPDYFSESTPRIYVWNSIDNTTLSTFPGEEMELVKDNLYKYEFKTDGKFTNLLFNDGNNNNIKTNDLDYICSEYVYKDDELVSYTKKDDVIYYKGNYVSNAYIYLYNSQTNESNANWPGEKMEYAGNKDAGKPCARYVVNSDKKFDKVIFNNGSSQTKTFDYISSGVVYTDSISFVPSYLKSGDTIYFEKNNNWSDSIYIYMWNSKDEYTPWKTTKMTKVKDNLYSYTLNGNEGTISLDGMSYVIFSDDTHQTKDLYIVGKTTLFKVNEDPISSETDLAGKFDGFWAYSQDKSTLSNLINKTQVKSDDKKYYTKESYKIYKEQMDLANTLMNTKYITVSYDGYTSQYEKSLIGLQFAYDNLKIDPTILSNKIDEMKKVDTTPYTKDSVESFNNSIKAAETILNDIDNLTIDKIKSSINDMQTAYDNLILDKTELKNLIDEANKTEKDKYTDDSVTNLESVVKDATEVYDDEDATYEEIKTQVSALKEAISKLELKPENNDSKTDEKVNNATTTAAENTSNPFTGDIIYVFIGLIILAIIALVLSFIISKKNKAKNTK